MNGFASPNNTYQWNDSNGAISGATSSTYVATATGTYSLTVTTPAGCVSTSSGVSVNIISVTVPSGLSTSNIQVDRATMNWSAVADAHHYDIRMRVQGSSSWTISLNNLFGTSKEKLNLTSSSTVMSGRLDQYVLRILVLFLHGHLLRVYNSYTLYGSIEWYYFIYYVN